MADTVYEAVLAKLLALEIRPQDRISVDGLARDLGVSQTPLRAALTRLETQGLVTKTHLIGYRAAPEMTESQFEQFYDARVQLEPFVTIKAASSISPEELDRMDALLDRLLTADASSSKLLTQVARTDMEFHRAIAVSSGNLVIANILETLQAQVQFTLLRRNSLPIDVRPATDEHRDILNALRKRDGAGAAGLMLAHLAASRKRYWPR